MNSEYDIAENAINALREVQDSVSMTKTETEKLYNFIELLETVQNKIYLKARAIGKTIKQL